MHNRSKKTIGVLVLTLNAEREIGECLRFVVRHPRVSRCLVIDSTSSDHTVDIAYKMGAEVLVIDRSEFNHGATRELGRQVLGTDIVVMLTQDAVLTSEESLAALCDAMEKGVDVAYGRQLPRPGSDVFEALPRTFNYPAQGNTMDYDVALHLIAPMP